MGDVIVRNTPFSPKPLEFEKKVWGDRCFCDPAGADLAGPGSDLSRNIQAEEPGWAMYKLKLISPLMEHNEPVRVQMLMYKGWSTGHDKFSMPGPGANGK